MSLVDVLTPQHIKPGRPTRSVRLLSGDEEREVPVASAPDEKKAARKRKEEVVAPRKRKYKRRAKPGPKPGAKRAPKSTGRAPRFGVFDDGSVRINLPGCKGDIRAGDARDLVSFISRLGK